MSLTKISTIIQKSSSSDKPVIQSETSWARFHSCLYSCQFGLWCSLQLHYSSIIGSRIQPLVFKNTKWAGYCNSYLCLALQGREILYFIASKNAKKCYIQYLCHDQRGARQLQWMTQIQNYICLQKKIFWLNDACNCCH